jgi:hypothetical protein
MKKKDSMIKKLQVLTFAQLKVQRGTEKINEETMQKQVKKHT